MNGKTFGKHFSQKGRSRFEVNCCWMCKPKLPRNASAVISGIRLLKRLMECSPAAIYWGYLDERARKLNMNFSSAEDCKLPISYKQSSRPFVYLCWEGPCAGSPLMFGTSPRRERLPAATNVMGCVKSTGADGLDRSLPG